MNNLGEKFSNKLDHATQAYYFSVQVIAAHQITSVLTQSLWNDPANCLLQRCIILGISRGRRA